MRKTIYLILILLVFVSCNDKEVKSLNSNNLILENRISQLELQLDQAQSQVDDLGSQLESSNNQLAQCNYNYEGYRYGKMYKLERFVKGQGMVTIYGADNALDFLWNHYCP